MEAEPTLSFWRDKNGRYEIDCIISKGNRLYPLEIKGGATIGSDYFKSLTYWQEFMHSTPQESYIFYGGSEQQKRSQGILLGWKSIGDLIEHLRS